MESLIEIFLSGLAVGLFVSAPMGPVGILCIQRTLYKGRKTGLYTGVGAAISDFLYCLLTGFGLAFIEDFIENNQEVIKLVGSAVLIGFAVYLFKKNPSVGLRKPEVQPGSPGKDILGGFLFTFSNPLILFLIIGLFARFNFLSPDYKFYHYILGYLAIIAGALGWWWVVTFFVDKLRAHFNVRSMWLINRCIGVLILLFALVGIITGIGSLTGWATNAAAPVFSTEPFTGRQAAYAGVEDPNEIYLRLDANSISPMWEAVFADSLNNGIKLRVVAKDKILDSDPVFGSVGSSRPQIMVSVYALPSDSLLLNSQIDRSRFDTRGKHAWIMRKLEGNWILSAGYAEPEAIGTFGMRPIRIDSVTFSTLNTKPISVSNVIIRGGQMLPKQPINSSEILGECPIAGTDLSGVWGIYDYDIDPDQVLLGGDYIVELIRNGSGYDIKYISGARIRPNSWWTGRLKGRLVSLPYPDVYNVEWADPEGMALGTAKGAVELQTGNLIIQFPARNSKIRLRKIK